MDERTPTAVSEETFLVDVTTIAGQFASLFMRQADADDIVQDVVLDCLATLREGGSPFDVQEHVGLVKTMVLRRFLNSVRGDDRRASRDAEHERDRSDSTHVWMEPDLGIEACEIEQFFERVVASLPPMCRRVFVMVRTEGASYQLVANLMGISRASVQSHVVTAQQRFRVALREEGVTLPARYTANRPARNDGPALVLHRPQQPAQAFERRNDAAA